MANTVYRINKGINKSIEFKGLKAQYIWYLGGGIIFLMIVFAVMYIVGIPSLLCVVIIGICGAILFVKVYAMSHKYGQYGMMKALAKRQIPNAVKNHSRKVFIKENNKTL